MTSREPHRRYNVGAVKISHADRNVARRVFGETGEHRGFRDVIGSDVPDDHEQFPASSPGAVDRARAARDAGESEPWRHLDGANTTYSFVGTETEAAEFAAASNCRYIERDGIARPVGAATGTVSAPSGVPSLRTMQWMRAAFDQVGQFPGTDIPVAILDTGTTQVMRDVQHLTLERRGIFGAVPLGEVFPPAVHGCYTASEGVPYGGQLLDGMICEADGESASFSAIATGIRWACDNGAQIISLSFGGPSGADVFVDALTYMIDTTTAVFYAAAGNDGQNTISYPANYATVFPRCRAVIAFDEKTDRKASFSNYSTQATCCGPGVLTNGLTPTGQIVQISGTSMATPHVASLAARAASGFRVTTIDAANALDVTGRNTGQATIYQGRYGAPQLDEALIHLGLMQGASGGGGGSSGGITTVSTRALLTL